MSSMLAPAVMMSVEEYLATSFEHDCDYLDGEAVERAMPDLAHSRLQTRLPRTLEQLPVEPRFEPLVELRLRIAARRYRVADIVVFWPDSPTEQVPSDPPLVAIEITSPRDALQDMLEKADEYHAWGVPHIWFADPRRRTLYEYHGQRLMPVEAWHLPECGVVLTEVDVFGRA